MTSAETRRMVDERLRSPLEGMDLGIGFVGCDLPIDLFAATGRPFGHLPWDVEPTPWADRWLESGFPYWARSILEQWNRGVFDRLDTVVFSRADDATQRLYYYVAELRRRGRIEGPVPRIFDIALVDRESSLEHTTREIAALADRFDVTGDGLAGGIERTNALRGKFAWIADSRVDQGPLYERLGRATLWSDAGAWIDGVVIPPAESARARRILLAGSVPPDDRLHTMVEAAGGTIVAEAHVHGLDRLGPEIAPGPEAPEHVLARHLRTASRGPRAMFDRAGWVLDRTRARRADAVLLWMTREDESLAWHLPRQKRGLLAKGIPTLTLAAARWQADGDTAEQIAAFLGSLTDATT